MQKFQYFVSTFDIGDATESHDALAPFLEEKGKKGWELVSVITFPQVLGGYFQQFIFKREYED